MYVQWKVLSAVGGYHQYFRMCSALRRIITIVLRRDTISSYYGGCWDIEYPQQYWWYPHTISIDGIPNTINTVGIGHHQDWTSWEIQMVSHLPTVLNEHPLQQWMLFHLNNEHPPIHWWYPNPQCWWYTVLNILHNTAPAFTVILPWRYLCSVGSFWNCHRKKLEALK